MCLCRDVIYWFCLVRSLCGEWHKSRLHYTIKGPVMQRACEHDGFGQDEQSFEASKTQSVLMLPVHPYYLKIRQTGQSHWKTSHQTIEGKLFGFRSFTQLLIAACVWFILFVCLFFRTFPPWKSRWWFYWQKPQKNTGSFPPWIHCLWRLWPSVTESDTQSTCGGKPSIPAEATDTLWGCGWTQRSTIKLSLSEEFLLWECGKESKLWDYQIQKGWNKLSMKTAGILIFCTHLLYGWTSVS